MITFLASCLCEGVKRQLVRGACTTVHFLPVSKTPTLNEAMYVLPREQMFFEVGMLLSGCVSILDFQGSYVIATVCASTTFLLRNETDRLSEIFSFWNTG
jgi:hypothetical protein